MVRTCVWSLLPTDHSARWLAGLSPLKLNVEKPLSVLDKYFDSVYETKKVITDGKQSLELYAFTGSPHVEPMVMAYVPGQKILFQSDLWFPATGGAGNPAAKQLYDSIKALKLDVRTNVGGHGGVGPFAELENAVKVP